MLVAVSDIAQLAVWVYCRFLSPAASVAGPMWDPKRLPRVTTRLLTCYRHWFQMILRDLMFFSVNRHFCLFVCLFVGDLFVGGRFCLLVM